MINAGLHSIKKLGCKTGLIQMIQSPVVQKSKQDSANFISKIDFLSPY